MRILHGVRDYNDHFEMKKIAPDLLNSHPFRNALLPYNVWNIEFMQTLWINNSVCMNSHPLNPRTGFVQRK